ncbi:MAG TPA: ABC transporter substrate-binding protein [Dehalococcoidia bacterium]|nr:ABC transporter substrate-binding protein [Dehalococcoidia bacterium]
MNGRLAWPLLSFALVVMSGLACTPQAPTTQPPSAASPAAGKESVKAAGSIPGTTPAPAGAVSPQSAASPTAATQPAASPVAAARGESKGQVTWAWYTSIPPAWLDPQEVGALITPYLFMYAVHDAVVKHLPNQPLAPSLAESYEIAPDFKSATFKLRPGIKFHNGDPVTPEDVVYSYEKYRGANAKVLHDKTERIETPDSRTVKFIFKEPFLDFLVLYGSPASGAGWVVPKAHYEQVGPDGFKQNPIGAGPYKFVRQSADTLELEAFTDYWRKVPHVQSLIIKGVTEDATRMAMLQTGEADLMYLVPGTMIELVKNDPNLTLAPVLGGSTFWLEFPGWEKPDNSFHNLKVRQAVSYALDRDAINQAEYGGYSQIIGNWIPEDWPGAIKAPPPEHDLAKAKQLMAEAGFPDGFDVESLSPIPPYMSLGERIISQLREIGIRTKLNTMERAVFLSKLAEGPEAFKGIVYAASGAPGDAAGRIRGFAMCQGVNSRTCVPEIDEKMTRYDTSVDPQERERLVAEVQQYIIDNMVFVPVFRQVGLGAQGPRIANKDEIWGVLPQFPTVGPYEDIRLRE